MAEHNTTFEVSSMTQLDNNSNVKALANVVINGEIAVNGVKVMEGEKGLFVAMPSKKVGGEFVDIAHPITDKAYEQISNAVLTDYSLVVDEAHNYKNGLVVSKMNRVSGVQTTPAQKSEDILMKTQFLNENYGEKNIIFATGTPVITPYQHSNTKFNINTRFIGNRHNLNHR